MYSYTDSHFPNTSYLCHIPVLSMNAEVWLRSVIFLIYSSFLTNINLTFRSLTKPLCHTERKRSTGRIHIPSCAGRIADLRDISECRHLDCHFDTGSSIHNQCSGQDSNRLAIVLLHTDLLWPARTAACPGCSLHHPDILQSWCFEHLCLIRVNAKFDGGLI